MIDFLKFDLQLFADETSTEEPTLVDTDVSAGIDTQDATSTATIDVMPQQTNKVVDCGSLRLEISDTGKPIIRNVQEDPANQVQRQETLTKTKDETALNTANESQEKESKGLVDDIINQPQPQEKTVYTDQEFALALQIGNVDENKIPPQHAIAYGQYKAKQEFTKHAEQQQQVTSEQSQKEFYLKIDEAAKIRALSDIGMTTEQLNDLEYSDTEGRREAYNSAVEWHRQQITTQLLAQQQAHIQQENQRKIIYQDIENRTNEIKKNEPNFDKIDVMMATRYQTLPFKEAQNIATTLQAFQSGTITPEQCKTLEKYYEDTRKAFYAQNNNLSSIPKQVKPPIVEKGGGGSNVDKVVDFSSLRTMNVRDRRQFIANFMNNRK